MIIFPFIKICLDLKKIFRFNINNIASKNKKFITFNKANLDKWLNLTKKERYLILKKESASYLSKRKLLLEEIRKEYKKVSKGNSAK